MKFKYMHSDGLIRPLARGIRLMIGAIVLSVAVSACGAGEGLNGSDQASTNATDSSTNHARDSGTTSSATSSGAGPTPSGTGNTIYANPNNYKSLIANLQPGDTLVLEAGDYDPSGPPGLPIFGLHGTAEQPITITGPESGAPARLIGRSTHNTIRLSDASFIVIKNLEIDGRNLGGAGVKAQGLAHHITLENLTIRGVGSNQQIVGIGTVGHTTWNWTIRGNTIIGAGTGMYLGNSDGNQPFIAGLIENNLFLNTIGYNMQIKHQNPWPNIAGIPQRPMKTIIRNNVFVKEQSGSAGAFARPNLLIGHQPESGPGKDSSVEIYGNFFYQNPTESLLQGEGNLAIYSNVMVNDGGTAISIQPHHGSPGDVFVFGNTIVASTRGIAIRGVPETKTEIVAANMVYAATPIDSDAATDNKVGTYSEAPLHLVAPNRPIGELDLFARAGSATGLGGSPVGVQSFLDWDKDFNGNPRDWTYRGAYSGDGVNPGWDLSIGKKGGQ